MKKETIINQLSTKFLQDLWQSKEYRNFPVELLRYFRQQTDISDGAIECWKVLYEMAFFDEDWAIQISKNSLARELNKSPAAITRYLNKLEEEGYIWRSERKFKGYSLASRIYVILPQAAIDAIAEKPDRKKAIKQCGTIDQLPQLNVVVVKKVEAEVKSENLDNSLQTNKSSCTAARGVISDTPKNNINKYIYNNKGVSKKIQKSVVDFFEDEEQKVDNSEEKLQLENNITALEEEVQNIYNDLAVLKGKEHKTKITNLWEMLNHKQSQETTLQNQLAKLEIKKKPNAVMQDGQRMLDANRLLRVQQAALKFTEGDKLQARELALGVVHEIRFGNLAKKSYKTGKAMTVDFALNIAVKLMRERRWESPRVN